MNSPRFCNSSRTLPAFAEFSVDGGTADSRDDCDEALEKILIGWIPTAIAFCHKQGIPERDRADVVGDASIRVLTSFDPQRVAVDPRAFLWWCLRTAIKRYRRACRSLILFGDFPESSRERSSDFFESTEMASPFDQLVARETEAILRRYLSKLPSIYRTVLIAVDLNGCSLESFSKRRGLNRGTVKSRLFRGRQMLRALVVVHFPELRL
jgi:RNA polymerase sigma factor (sigma-70 family)